MTIAVIALVAVVMGMSTIAPTLQQAFAHDVREQVGPDGTRLCPAGFQIGTITPGVHPDHNINSLICEKRTRSGTVTIDDVIPLLPQRPR